MASVPDISDTKTWVIETTLRERCDRGLDDQIADAEVRVHPADRGLSVCPVVYWQAQDGCDFVTFKTGEGSDRSQFLHKPCIQTGSGSTDDDDLAECAVAMLQAQADHVAEERGDLPGREG